MIELTVLLHGASREKSGYGSRDKGNREIEYESFPSDFHKHTSFLYSYFYAYSAKLYEKKREGRGVQLKKDKK